MKIKSNEKVFINCDDDNELFAVLILELFLMLCDFFTGSSKYTLYEDLYKKLKDYKDIDDVYYVDRQKYRLRLKFISNYEKLRHSDLKKFETKLFEIFTLLEKMHKSSGHKW